MKYDYVIYHKNCLDGFSGFFILTLTGLISNKALIYPDNPYATAVPPGIDNKNVIIIDVAYKQSILETIFSKSKSTIFIDHHETIRDSTTHLTTNTKYKHHKIIYDGNESGVSLVWKHFFPNKKMPKFVKYIKDNDIGKWKYNETLPFVSALDVLYKTEPSRSNLKQWKKLMNDSEIKKLIKIGTIYNQYKEHLMNMHYKRYSRESFPSEKIYNENPTLFTKPGQYIVALYCGNGCPTSSLLGKKLVNDVKCDFAILWTYHMDEKKFVLTFRSKSVDVGKIATFFGGGGHKLASSANFNKSRYNSIDELFFPQSLPRN